jgi:hypothetical protein
MRLLNVYNFELREFHDKFIPPYGILSHRWGRTEDEASYEELRQYQKDRTKKLKRLLAKGQNTRRPGLKKVLSFCEFVRHRKVFNFNAYRKLKSTAFEKNSIILEHESEALQWVWIDTVCIDKSSSADVSEAINSMFAWYSYAEECYVYLSEMSTSDLDGNTIPKVITEAEWFTRGWTLQELLASKTRIFCAADWKILGQISCKFQPAYSAAYSEQSLDLTTAVSKTTGIESSYLNKLITLDDASIAKRMSWAAPRRTTRVEDRAYCLLGLFGVNMLPIYGEGRNAFIRLQEEIVRRSHDQSIFVWKYVADENPDGVDEDTRETAGMFAPNAGCFPSRAGSTERIERVPHPSTITNIGLKLKCPSWEVHWPSVDDPACILRLVRLNYRYSRDNAEEPGSVELLVLECRHHEVVEVYRSRCNNKLQSSPLEQKFLRRDRKPEEPDLKFFSKTFCSLRNQCSKCRSNDDQLVASLGLVQERDSGHVLKT